MMLFFVTVQDTDKATIYIVSILMEVLRAVAQFEVPVSDRFLSVFVFVHHALGENQSLFSIYIYINDFSVTLHMFANKEFCF